MRNVYLDHAATSPVRVEVVEAMLPHFTENYGNPSSLHMVGQRAKRALEQARRVVASALGASSREIYFTAGGTASDNLAIKGVAHASRGRGKHLITSMIEHHAVLNTCHFLEKEGFEVTYLPVDSQGIVDLEALEKSIRDDTILVSVMLANNEVGTLQPLDLICAMAHERGVLVHTDAVQAVGKTPVDPGDMGIDLLSLTAHKFHGPKGIGVLYVRRGTQITPMLHGGHQERELWPGTENLPGIVGLAKALELSCQELPVHADHLRRLRDSLKVGIHEHIDLVHRNGHPEQCLPNILNMSFEDVDGEALLMALDTQGIAVSTGSACSAGSTDPSHVLLAMGLERRLAQGSLRFSLGLGNDEADISYTLEVLKSTVARLRAVSPVHHVAA